MTLVIGTIKDVSGVADNTEWRFSSILRENNAGTGVVTTKTVVAKPVAGALSAAVDPGFVVVNYRGNTYNVTVPNQTSIDVWDLISITVPLPASAVSAFGNSLATAPNAASARASLSAEFTGNKGIASGYAGLDSGGKIPVSQLPNSIMEYQGIWNASTNTPTLANGTGSAGDVYRVSVAGTQFSVSFSAGDYVIYNGSVWERSSSSSFTSTGAVTGSQLVSTVATGTAPLTVASSTVVANLNAATTNGYGPAQTAAANTLAARDGNTNLQARGFISGFTSTVTSATTVTLIASSSQIQEFTGTLAQTVVLPTAGVVAGQQYTIINNSTATVAVQSSALNAILGVAAGTEAKFTALVATPTTAAHWEYSYAVDPVAVQTLTNKTLTTPTLTTPVINGISTGTGVSVASTINTLGLRDGSGRMFAHNFVPVFTTTATAAGTTTLVNSHGVQEFTGTTTQTCVLPTTGVSAGQSFTIINNSTGAVTVQSSALATIGATLTTGQSAQFFALVATPTTAAHWHRR